MQTFVAITLLQSKRQKTNFSSNLDCGGKFVSETGPRVCNSGLVTTLKRPMFEASVTASWTPQLFTTATGQLRDNCCGWRPGHTALYGLITAKTRQKVVSRETDDVVRVDVEFKTSCSRFMDVAGRGENSERRRTRQKNLNCSKF